MEYTLETILEVKQTLEYTLLNSQNKSIRARAYSALNTLNDENVVIINNTPIPVDVYKDLVEQSKVNRIRAIKMIKDNFDLGLKEAKDISDAIMKKENL